jgi:hypothetical protein
MAFACTTRNLLRGVFGCELICEDRIHVGEDDPVETIVFVKFLADDRTDTANSNNHCVCHKIKNSAAWLRKATIGLSPFRSKSAAIVAVPALLDSPGGVLVQNASTMTNLPPPTANTRDEALEAAGVVEKWVAAINAGKAEDAAALYAADALLLPTFSTHALDGEEGRLDYLQSLASREGLRVSMHEKTLRVRCLPGSIQIASGIYRFSFEIDGEPLTFEARFTWVMDVSRERPIQHHHSSQLPRTLG